MDVRREEQSKGKVKRIPLGGLRYKLQMSDEDRKGFEKRGMVPRWFNDANGEVEQAQAAGYTFAKPEDARSVGFSSLGERSKSLGAQVTKVVSKGEFVMEGCLMEVKKEFYEEDKAADLALTMRVDDAIALGGTGGADVENHYRP